MVEMLWTQDHHPRWTEAQIETALIIWEDFLDSTRAGAPDTEHNQCLTHRFTRRGTVDMRHVAIALAPRFEAVATLIDSQKLDFNECWDWEIVPALVRYCDWTGTSPKVPTVSTLLANLIRDKLVG